MKIAVGICVKDSERTIERAVYSVLNQTYPKELMQVIFVDGCSRDKTLSIIRRLISEANIASGIFSDYGRGLGAARQVVVNNAKGDYLIFVDGDVELQGDFVQKQFDYMEGNPKVAVAVGRYMFRRGNLLSSVWSLYNSASRFLGNDATIYRLEAIKQVGGFDENIKGASEDKDLIYRILQRGWSFSVNEEALFYHDCRQSLRGFWNEQAWFGFGNHYLNHKYRNLGPLWRNLPVGSFRYGSKLARKSYKTTNKKMSFLVPLLMVFGNIAWWIGFVKAHLEGYGHGTS